MALPITMYGSYTCQDTALARDRLRTLRVPFKQVMREDDVQVTEILAKHNAGVPVTPTLVFGDDEMVIAEPTIEQLEEMLIKAGHTFAAPQAKTLRAQHYAPDLTQLPAYRSNAAGPRIARPQKIVVFFAHSEGCRVCQGYAKQLAAHLAEIAECGAPLQIVLQAHSNDLEKWSKEFAPNVEMLADVDGALKRTYADYLPDDLDARRGGTWLVILDREEVPRVGVYGSDAGGLITPTQITQGLKGWNF